MRDLISQMMLVVDELWLSHAQHMRAAPGFSPRDAELEEALFSLTGLLQQAAADLPVVVRTTVPRPADAAAEAPSRMFGSDGVI